MKNARLSLMPRSWRNLSSSSWRPRSSVSNFRKGTLSERGGLECDEAERETHLGTDVETAALPVRLGGEVRGQFGLTVERHVLEDKDALLACSVDAQCTRDGRLRSRCQMATKKDRACGGACTVPL